MAFKGTFAVISGVNTSGMNVMILDPVVVSTSEDGTVTVTGRTPVFMANLDAAAMLIRLTQGREAQ